MLKFYHEAARTHKVRGHSKQSDFSEFSKNLLQGGCSLNHAWTCHSEEPCDEESIEILHFVQNDTGFDELHKMHRA